MGVCPDNGVYIIQGEVNLVVTAMRRNSRWTSHNHQDEEQDPLLNNFSKLKDLLNIIAELKELAPNEFLSPFLEVIKSEDTTGPITGLALTSINKFLSYSLIDPHCETAAAAIENIADAVTHARFVGTDPSSDEVVLMKILHVLRTLLLTPAGAMLTNESVCEIMQSCFRICFEMRLSELLRKSAEHTLMDMVQLLFSRLPQFKEDLKMRTGGMDPSRSSKHRKRSPKSKHKKSNTQQPAEPPAAHPGQSSAELAYPPAPEEASRGSPLPPDSLALTSPTDEEHGVRFTPDQMGKEGAAPLIPYGLPCVRELFRFLVSLTSPVDRHNTDVMVHMGLSLLTVALEAGADNISAYSSLLALVKDDMLKNLLFLLQSERLSLFAAAMRVCFLLFESMRGHLKLQLEMYLNKLQEIIVSDSPRISYEQREIALESIVQLLRIPGLITELYLNYDCDLYCTNLFEDLMKLLSKNAFPVSGLFSTHLLSLDALLAVIDSIEQHCHHRVDSKETDEKNGETESKEAPAPKTAPAAARNIAKIRPNRMKVTASIPSEEELAAIKYKKKLYQTGTEQFNQKPSKGVSFLQEHELLSTPLDAEEVVEFIKGNPKLDKKQIGEYISNKKNNKVLEAYQKSFVFDDTRVDEALRMYLETFRLPGEAPVISYILEHFADHWHKTNGEPFANADAAFTLAYAVIMLNVDQHNTNAKKQNIPMTVHEFKKNLTKVNGGEDFEQEMLDEMYQAVKSDEIVMPAEQTGIVKENYMWKVLIRRGAGSGGSFIHAPTGALDRELFSLVWGPTVAALSFVFDKSLEETIIQKAVTGFRKCAMISAHYDINDVFDNLVISLCKFTTLLSSVEFGNNSKAQLSARTVFNLAQSHGHILREGWKNILDCMLQLYRAKLLPEVLVKVEDFLDPSGKVSLIREDVSQNQRSDSGVLSSFYSYFVTETPQQRGPSPEEQEAIRKSQRCLQDCHVERLITESKFLIEESLLELAKALIAASNPDLHDNGGCGGISCYDDADVFFLELLIKVVLQNRDRINNFWQSIRDHFYDLAVNATEHTFLLERTVVGLLRLAIRLLRREEISSQVLASLRILLMIKPTLLHSVGRHVAYALHELLRTNAANIHSADDWYTLFTLLEVVGAGTNPPPMLQQATSMVSLSDTGAQSDSELTACSGSSEAGDRGYNSDGELYAHDPAAIAGKHVATEGKGHVVEAKPLPASHGSWMLVYSTNKTDGEQRGNQFSIVLNEELKHHDSKSLIKCCETLAFLVRDAAHVTPHNFESCVHAIRVFVEASINGAHLKCQQQKAQATNEQQPSGRKARKLKKAEENKMKKSKSSPSHLQHIHESDDERENDDYHSISIQLLDLMHTLHTRAASIFSSWAEEEKCRLEGKESFYLDTEGQQEAVKISAEASTLWVKCWCPLLQGIARLCCDARRNVRSQALTYLQRALLVHDLQTLSAVEWENCFNKVLFPLLSNLLESINPQDPTGIEETRMRASTLLCKVFLQHLSPLLSLSTFTALWLTILEFMDKFMHVDKSDLLCEAIPESLKNMLLVMHTAGILSTSAGERSQLWKLTWDRIDTFLPNLRREVFKPHEEPKRPTMTREPSAEAPEAAAEQLQQEQQHLQQQQQQYHHLREQYKQLQQLQLQQQMKKRQKSAEGHSPERSPPDSPPQQQQQQQPCILHPPLPSSTVGSSQVIGTMPILLNPDIMQGTAIPIISPQLFDSNPPPLPGLQMYQISADS
ncbi:hypothetical protein CAPTEDRAFT_227129 [Capitella teleta]|uniref:SEC7 domain-containing protein n=1 Tax=Capitella teleta TaxID=283909 RepID=R7UJM2_CAPTE|nr:hypothetical protein CAPTEDRAFT_227129 [Capitella teleta]|eukprot:ELU03437.1 hypothetical protein CAPTEDRAFT_227129 [Capitella teleta]